MVLIRYKCQGWLCGSGGRRWWRGQGVQFHIRGRKRPERWEVRGIELSGVGLGASQISWENVQINRRRGQGAGKIMAGRSNKAKTLCESVMTFGLNLMPIPWDGSIHGTYKVARNLRLDSHGPRGTLIFHWKNTTIKWLLVTHCYTHKGEHCSNLVREASSYHR